MPPRSEWLTGLRIRRLQQLLLAIPTLPASLSRREVYMHLWRKCGGPLEEIAVLVGVLAHLRLVRDDAESLKRTTAGDKLAKSLRRDTPEVFGLTLIRAGHFYDQARLVTEIGKIAPDGSLRCAIRQARTSAPQLVALIERWNGVAVHPELLIPAGILKELNTVWALLPPETEVPKWAAERKAVGNRAEMYTVQHERTRTTPSNIRWVARDSDSLGYDVEDTSMSPSRCIEVKGRRDSEVIFYLSESEWNKAKELAERYEVQFWGEIDLNVEPAVGYTLLRDKGYPITFRHPVSLVGTRISTSAVAWRCSLIPAAPDEQPDADGQNAIE